VTTVEIGDRFRECAQPRRVWSVVGLAEADGSTIALMLATDGTRFREVPIDTLLSSGSFTPARRQAKRRRTP